MAMPATNAKPNTLFATSPAVVWQLRRDKDLMVKEQEALMGFIDGLLEAGFPQFFFGEGADKKTLQQTSNGGFFRVILRSPPEEGQDDVELAFSLRDLYLLGFLQGNVWRLYTDARLDGTGHLEPEHRGEWTWLGYRGNYQGDRFNHVEVGFPGLMHTVETLLNYSEREDDEVITALFRIIVMVAEAKRFPDWLLQLLDMLSSGQSRPVGNTFGNLFTKWSKISGIILKGPADFEPAFGFDTYGAMVAALSVLLRKKREKDKIAEAEFRIPARVFDPDYDME